MRGSRLFYVLAVVLILAVALTAGCSPAPAPSPGAPAPSSIKIGAVVPLTGAFAGGGNQVATGYRYAVDDINAAGGVLVGGQRIPLELIILDDESDPMLTVSRLEHLHDAENVVAYLGGFGSSLHAAAAAIAEKNQVPYMGVAFALWDVHQRGYRYLFSPFWKSPDGVGIFAFLNDVIPEGQRPTRVAIFQEKTDWGIEMANFWREAAPQYGYEIVVDVEYAVGTPDFSDIITRAAAADAELVLALPVPPDGMALFKQMAELNYNPKAAYFIRAPDAVYWGETLGSLGDYVMLSPGWHHGVQYAGVDALNARHQADHGRPADVMVGPAYATVQILADAVSRAGSVDREAVRDAIAATDLDTVTGRVSFRADGTGDVDFFIVQWQDGKPELVGPAAFATAPLVYPMTLWNQR